MTVSISKREAEAIHAAGDFIETHADGAEDHAPFAEMMDSLHTLFEKYKKARHKALVKHYLKKSKNKSQSPTL